MYTLETIFSNQLDLLCISNFSWHILKTSYALKKLTLKSFLKKIWALLIVLLNVKDGGMPAFLWPHNSDYVLNVSRVYKAFLK